MGLLIDGKWHDQWYDTSKTGGHFVRQDSQFRNGIVPADSPEAKEEGCFAAESGRYHLYVSLACPCANRTLIMRNLKGLQDMISISVVHWLMVEHGWTFQEGPGVIPDTVNHARYMYEVYTAADPHYTGRVTVPVLWDKKTSRIVNNESSEILRIFNSAFDSIGARKGDYYPEPYRQEIDELNARVYDLVNNGVYKAGFSTTQSAYEEAVYPLFEMLDELEQRLSHSEYLVGNQLTEADIRLFTTLIRFDPVYVGHFKCNIRRIADYPALYAYTKRLHAMPEIASTINFEHIKKHYYQSHKTINPTGVVPVGPTDIA